MKSFPYRISLASQKRMIGIPYSELYYRTMSYDIRLNSGYVLVVADRVFTNIEIVNGDIMEISKIIF